MAEQLTNRLVAEWDNDGRLEVKFIPINLATIDTNQASQLNSDAQAKHQSISDPSLQSARHEFEVLGLSSLQRHIWGE